jgi:hypothetical protein
MFSRPLIVYDWGCGSYLEAHRGREGSGDGVEKSGDAEF